MDTARQVIGGKLMEKDVEPWFAGEIVAALDAAGYAIVPKEPTPRMMAAAHMACDEHGCVLIKSGYVAMIEAAPQ